MAFKTESQTIYKSTLPFKEREGSKEENMIFDRMELGEYEQVVFCNDKTSGLKAIIAIHDTTLGPALGGCRIWNYDSEEQALVDALRLAKGMTYKNAAAGLNLGGGKTVIIANPETDKTEALMRAYGRFVEGLAGRYITAEDVGSTPEDMDYVFLETDFVTGISESYGSSGNPSPFTAYGVFRAMERTAKQAFGSDSLEGKKVVVQGAGSVGESLISHLVKAGAKVTVSDINSDHLREISEKYGVKSVKPDEIFNVEADIFAPCAMGGIINDETIKKIKAKAICGSANNQLLDTEKHGKILKERGIIYAPDFIVNAGGVINIAEELTGYSQEQAKKSVGRIYEQLGAVFELAEKEDIPTAEAAKRFAEERIETIKSVRKTYLSSEKSAISGLRNRNK